MTQWWYLDRTKRSWNPHALDDVRQYLSQKVAGRIILAFDTLGREYGRAWGLALRKDKKPHVILLAAEIRDYFTSGHRSTSRDLSTSFMLGITIVHELAHAVYFLLDNALLEQSKFDRQASQHHHSNEPFFSENDMPTFWPVDGPEHGWCLERYLFGLEFDANLTSDYGALALNHRPPSNRTVVAQDASILEYPTPQESITKFFRKEKWENVSKKCMSDLAEELLPTLQYSNSPGSENMLVYVPNAALIDPSDGLFIYSLNMAQQRAASDVQSTGLPKPAPHQASSRGPSSKAGP